MLPLHPTTMTLLIIYLSLALGISFICSILEAVLLSTPRSFISMKEAEGSAAATLLAQLKDDIDRPISAILILNTTAHTVGAAGVGAQAAIVFGEAYFGLISAVLTLLILVLSEIIPKTLGANFYRTLALPSARVLKVLIFVIYPLVWISELITKIFSSKHHEATVSREEVSAMVSEGTREGVIHSSENIIFQNIIKMGQIPVRKVMTPRVVCITANEELTQEEFYEECPDDSRLYSRIPVYAEDKDFITGYVLFMDIMEHIADDEEQMKLSEIRRPILVLNEATSVSAAWERLLAEKEHIAMVVDEYGTFQGLITMEDIMETILGLEITDEKDTVADMQVLAREKWQERRVKYKQFLKKDETVTQPATPAQAIVSTDTESSPDSDL